jgi:hypothetical protein
VRVTTAFSSLLRLPGVWVRKVRFEPEGVVVEVARGADRWSVRNAATPRGRERTPGRELGRATSRSGGTILSWRRKHLDVWLTWASCSRLEIVWPGIRAPLPLHYATLLSRSQHD